nr:MAG TPA: hypothetical protein [Caudoviricetes sp.]
MARCSWVSPVSSRRTLPRGSRSASPFFLSFGLIIGTCTNSFWVSKVIFLVSRQAFVPSFW